MKNKEWDKHKYIEKRKTKTGKIRYIYPDDIKKHVTEKIKDLSDVKDKLIDEFNDAVNKYKPIVEKKMTEFKQPEKLIPALLTGNPLLSETIGAAYDRIEIFKKNKQDYKREQAFKDALKDSLKKNNQIDTLKEIKKNKQDYKREQSGIDTLKEIKKNVQMDTLKEIKKNKQDYKREQGGMDTLKDSLKKNEQIDTKNNGDVLSNQPKSWLMNLFDKRVNEQKKKEEEKKQKALEEVDSFFDYYDYDDITSQHDINEYNNCKEFTKEFVKDAIENGELSKKYVAKPFDIDTEMERMKLINPNKENSDGYTDSVYMNNCARCTLAVELRDRGYDVTAGIGPEGMYSRDIFLLFDRYRDSKVYDEIKYDTDLIKDVEDKVIYIENEINIEKIKNSIRWQTGDSKYSRGAFSYNLETYGHILNWKYDRINDELIFEDGQTSKVYTEEEYAQKLNELKVNNVFTIRTDNSEIYWNTVMEYCMLNSGEENKKRK